MSGGATAGIAFAAAVVVAAVVVHRFLAFAVVVRSDSMRPALAPGDVLLTSRARRRPRLRRGEILVHRAADGAETAVTRLIGLPGDRVQLLDDGVVVVNGEPVFEPYARRAIGFRGSFTVPRDRCFVLDDQRGGPHAAQAWRDSFVPVGDVLGVVRVRILPWPITATGVLAR